MITALLLTLREGLEAALIVAVVVAALRRAQATDLLKYARLGLLGGILASLAAAGVLAALGIAFEGRAEELFEGIVMLVAAGVLTWAVFWMKGQAHTQQLERAATQHATAQAGWGIFALVLVAVLREGIELALFLLAAAMSIDTPQVLAGAGLGLAAAVALGWLLYTGGIRISLRAFFRVTSALLVVVAAGLVAHGIHELQEAGVVPIVIEHVWNLNPVLAETSTLGLFLKALFGYNGNPSLLEVLGYAAYLITAGAFVIRRFPRGASSTPTQSNAAHSAAD